MVKTDIPRRQLCLGIAGLSMLTATGLHSEDVADLDWRDLVPQGQPYIPPAIQGLLPHDETAMASQQPTSSGVKTDWNGQIVRLSGFIIPLDFKGTGVTAFMLVPYVGACIHVPPPPANQLVLVTTEKPFEGSGLFAAVTVTGMFGTASTSTQLAEIGYALSADSVAPYRG